MPKKKPIDPAVSAAAAAIGAIGGRATGASKRRPPEHYTKMALAKAHKKRLQQLKSGK